MSPLAERAMTDAAFQAACQRYAHGNGSSGAIAAAALATVGAQELLEALKGAVGALEFSRDFHNDLGNAEQAFCQDRLDAAVNAIAKAEGRA